MTKLTDTIQAWYDSGKRQLETGKYLVECDFYEMPCYHFRMSVEIFMKTLYLFHEKKNNLRYFDKKPIHDFFELLSDMEGNNHIGREMANNLRNSLEVFQGVDYPKYKYVTCDSSASLQSPSELFFKEDVESCQKAAYAMLDFTLNSLGEILANDS